MEQELKQMLRDKMDSLRSGPESLDKSAAWQALEARLDAGEPRRKRFAIPLVLRYAAAAALLVFGCLLWLRRQESCPAIARQDGPARRLQQAPLANPAPAPAASAPLTRAAAQAPVKVPAVGQQQQAVVTAAAPLQHISPDVVDTALLTGIPPQPEAATAAVSPKRRAMHLLDVSTEDRSALLPREPEQGGSRLSIQININRTPEGNQNRAPASIFRGLLPPSKF